MRYELNSNPNENPKENFKTLVNLEFYSGICLEFSIMIFQKGVYNENIVDDIIFIESTGEHFN